ncbi:MAG: hypothetical protein IJE05_04895 [Clostridia bacterium]|nr:hypothetical protein [Clostridia bacterium]
MKEGNKIINLNDYKQQKNNRKYANKYNQSIMITVEIFENNGKYSFDFIYPKEFSKYQILKILNKIYLKVSKTTPEPKFEFRDALNMGSFTIIYLEDKKNPDEFKFLCTNPKVTDWKLYIILSIINRR